VTTRTWLKCIIRAFPIVIAAGLCCLAPVQASAASVWTITEVDNSASVGRFPSLALDTDKKMHISYFDSQTTLKYATNKTDSWALSSVSGNVSLAGTAIAVDASTNKAQISYYYNAGTSKGIRNVAYGGWGPASDPNGGNFTPGSMVATSIFNKGGFSHLTYVMSGKLYYTKNTTANQYTAWSTPTLIDGISSAGYNNSIVADAAGKAYVVGYNSTSTDLFFYTNETGSWVKSDLVTSTADVGKGCSLAIDASGNLHLSYLETTATPTYRIKYLQKPVGLPWQNPVDVEDAGSFGGAPSIAVDSTGVAHISFYYSTSSPIGMLRYATNQGGSWNSEDVDKSAAKIGDQSSIAVDSDKTVNIAYYDYTNTALKVATTRKALLATPGPALFGTVDRGFQSSPGTTVTVTNYLLVSQLIGSLVTGGANPSEFVMVSDSCSHILLAPGQSCTAQLNFAPPASAPRSTARSATLAIPVNSPSAWSLALPLGGSTSDNYLVTASAGNGGSISPAKVAVAPGGSQVFSVTPSAGFSVATVTADGRANLTDPYTLTGVSADQSVLAALVSPIRILESSICYGSLQSAYGATNAGWTLQSQESIPAGDLLVDRDLSLKLSGGYDSSFTAQSGMTKVQGNLTIRNGTVNIDKLRFM
jgi:hypothetical protein